jgi:hypothetical protein
MELVIMIMIISARNLAGRIVHAAHDHMKPFARNSEGKK